MSAQARGDRRGCRRIAAARPAPDGGWRDQSRDAGNYVTINGSGSSWAGRARPVGRRTCTPRASRSTSTRTARPQGRQDYMQGQVDFAASDPPFRNGHDQLGRHRRRAPVRYGYSYVPDTAGGTAFMYHLDVGGQADHQPAAVPQDDHGDLHRRRSPTGTTRRSPRTTAPSCRTSRSRRWSASDGSGATYFFTRWMAHLFPSQWNAFCSKVTHGRVSCRCGADRVLPDIGLGQRQGRERLQQRRHLHHRELRPAARSATTSTPTRSTRTTRWSRC